MTFDNPLLKAAFEENKRHLEERLKKLEEIDRDIKQIETNLKSLGTPPGEQHIEGLGPLKWDGQNVKFNKKNLIQCKSEVRLQIEPFLIDFMKFILKGGS